ncbi:GNAT family N-acetyltransferase [bacterium]|nr:GNAT family N-acetyltransferase [bacterium]
MKSLLPEPPEGLTYEDVSLFYVGVMPGDENRGIVPYYHHRILVDSADVGHINFKVGDTDHVRLYAGHVGFSVKPVYRGHGYAGKACRALTPLLARHYDDVILTADPENLASRRTIEGLGACFENEVPVPLDDPQAASGSRFKRRYRWNLSKVPRFASATFGAANVPESPQANVSLA